VSKYLLHGKMKCLRGIVLGFEAPLSRPSRLPYLPNHTPTHTYLCTSSLATSQRAPPKIQNPTQKKNNLNTIITTKSTNQSSEATKPQKAAAIVTMVVTRRSRSEDEDGPLLGRQQQQQRPPPPPPPMIGNNAVGNNNLNQNNAINIGDAGSNENEVHATNNIIEAVAMNSDNSFLQVRALPPQSIQSSTVTSPFRPFHIHKRKNYAARASSWPPSASAAQNTTHNPSSQSASERRGFLSTSTVGGRKQNVTKNIHNNMTSQQQHQQQQSPSLPSSTSTYTDGEIVRILLPPNGFASERHLAECLRQAGETTTATTTTSFVTTNDTVQHHHDDYDDNASWDSMDEYYCDYNYYLSNQRERESSHYNRFSGGIQNSTAVVAGMFRESDRVFIPLSLIYANPTLFVGDVLSLKRPPPPPPSPLQPQPPRRLDVAPPPSASLMWQQRRPMFIQFLEIFGIVIVAMTSWWSYSAASRIDWGHVTDVMITKFEVFVWGSRVLRVDPFTRVCKKWVLIFAAAAVAFANDDAHHRLRTRFSFRRPTSLL